MSIYCVYLTIYKGNKLPKFYIGSSSLQKIKNGYLGSVNSIKYGEIWKDETKNNRHLFETKVVTKHKTRKEALEKELKLQLALRVQENPLYINLSYARPNGCHGYH